MKGLIFTEFLDMVESEFGLAVVDAIIERSNLPSEGVYTSVGTYDFAEMLSLVTELQKETGLPLPDLLRSFGHYLFGSLKRVHPEVMSSYESPMAMIASIEDHIHVHVRKLYPDAELPTFKVLSREETSLELIYSSRRGLGYLALGLIEKTFEHFGKEARIEMEAMNEEGTEVRFVILQYAEC